MADLKNRKYGAVWLAHLFPFQMEETEAWQVTPLHQSFCASSLVMYGQCIFVLARIQIMGRWPEKLSDWARTVGSWLSNKLFFCNLTKVSFLQDSTPVEIRDTTSKGNQLRSVLPRTKQRDNRKRKQKNMKVKSLEKTRQMLGQAAQHSQVLICISVCYSTGKSSAVSFYKDLQDGREAELVSEEPLFYTQGRVLYHF